MYPESPRPEESEAERQARYEGALQVMKSHDRDIENGAAPYRKQMDKLLESQIQVACNAVMDRLREIGFVIHNTERFEDKLFDLLRYAQAHL